MRPLRLRKVVLPASHGSGALCASYLQAFHRSVLGRDRSHSTTASWKFLAWTGDNLWTLCEVVTGNNLFVRV